MFKNKLYDFLNRGIVKIIIIIVCISLLLTHYLSIFISEINFIKKFENLDNIIHIILLVTIFIIFLHILCVTFDDCVPNFDKIIMTLIIIITEIVILMNNKFNIKKNILIHLSIYILLFISLSFFMYVIL